MANDKELQVQAESIDTGKPENIIWKEVDIPTDIQIQPRQKGESEGSYVGRAAALQNYYSAPQTQGEFKAWDDDLDKGIRSGDLQSDVRAKNQGALGELGTGLVKMGTEVILGTLSATALIPQTVAQLLGAEGDYTNTMSEAIDAYKADINEKYGKTYVSKENEGFAPLSSEYWANNAGNVATTISLMLPTWGFTKVLGATAKALKIEQRVMALARGAKEGSMLGQAAKWTVSVPGKQTLTGLAAATFSRNVESTMEASQTYKEVEGSFIESETSDGLKIYKINPQTGQRFTEQEVKQFAGDAASSNYKKNWLMVAQDFMMYSHLFKTFDTARRSAEGLKKGVLKSAGSKALDMLGEGAEEGYQYISNKESIDTQLVRAGLKKESNWTDRYGEYFTDDEFKSSVLQGVVGAGVFQAVGALQGGGARKQIEENRRAIEKIHQTYNASMVGDVVSFESGKYEAFIDSTIDKARVGAVDLIETDLDYLINDTDANIEAQGYDPKEYRNNIRKVQDLTAKTATEYNKFSADPTVSPAMVAPLTKAKMDIHLAEDTLPTIATQKEEAYKKDLTVFESKDIVVAQDMLKLKKLIANSEFSTSKELYAKAEELSQNIASRSTVLTTQAKVFEALSTAQDELLEELKGKELFINDVKNKAKEFISDMKNPLAQKEFIEKQQAKTVAKKVYDVLKEDGIVGEESKSSIVDAAQTLLDKTKIENPEATTEELQAIVSTELSDIVSPKQVDSTVDTTTYTVGDKIKVEGSRGIYTISSVAGGDIIVTNDKSGITLPLSTLLGQFKSESGELPTLSIVPKSVESAKPELDIVESTQIVSEAFDTFPEVGVPTEVPYSAEPSILLENTPTTTEFSNTFWRLSKSSEGEGFNLHLSTAGDIPSINPSTAKEFTEEFKIDYQAQSTPLHSPEKVSLEAVYVTSNKGEQVKSILIRNKDSKVIGQIGKTSGVSFEELHTTLISNGPSQATLNNKVTSLSKNLANVKVAGTQRYSKGLVSFFEDCPEFMPKDDIWIGTCDNEQGIIKYYNARGEVFNQEGIKVPGLTKEQKQIGPTFILMYDPGANLLPIFLQDVKTKDAKIDGIPLKDIINTSLTAKLSEIQTEINDSVAQGALIEDVRSNFEGWNKMFHEVAYEHLRMVPEFRKDTTPDQNHFQLDVVFPKDPKSTTLSIRVSYRDPRSKDGSVGVRKMSTDPTIVDSVIGERFYGITTEGLARPDGSMVKLILDNNLLTTDIYSKRPWINPILKLTLDERLESEISPEALEVEKDVNVTVVPEVTSVKEEHASTNPTDLTEEVNFVMPSKKHKSIVKTPTVVSAKSSTEKESVEEPVNTNIVDLGDVLNEEAKKSATKKVEITGCK